MARQITPYARQPPENDSLAVITPHISNERYKRRIAQTAKNLCLEIAIARLFPSATPVMLTRENIDFAKNYIRNKEPAQISATQVLSRIPDIFSYDTESIYGVTRHIDQAENEHPQILRQMAFDWLSANGVPENDHVLREERKKEMTASVSSTETSNCQENQFTREGPAKNTHINDERTQMSDREIEIAHALNGLLSGYTDRLSADEAAGDVVLSGHAVPDLMWLLMNDVAVTECCLSPNLSEDEIHVVAADILFEWSDDKFVRQQSALDAAHEYRKPTPPAKATIAPVTTVQPCNDAEPEKIIAPATTALTYQQQLTIAALHGLCANPAYCIFFEELAGMATLLAHNIINQQGEV